MHRQAADATTLVRLAAEGYSSRFGGDWTLAKLPEAMGIEVEPHPGSTVWLYERRGRAVLFCPPAELLTPLGGLLVGRVCVNTMLGRAGVAAPEDEHAPWALLARLVIPQADLRDLELDRVLIGDVARARACPSELVALRLVAGRPESAAEFDAWVAQQAACLRGRCDLRGTGASRRGENAGPRPEARRAERPYSRAWPFRPGDVKG